MEPPGGSDSRTIGPFYHDSGDPEQSLFFWHYNCAKRGVTLHGSRLAVIDSSLAEFKDQTQDTQAIESWNGPGPFKIVNNHLEGAAENILFGGADPSVPNLVPSDIEIRGNHIIKPLSWWPGSASYNAPE